MEEKFYNLSLMIFFGIILVVFALLFWNIRQIIPGKCGSLIAGVLLAMTFLCFLFRENFFACVGQTFLFVWLCQALLLYLLFDFFLLGKFLLFRIQKKKTENAKIKIWGSRILFGLSLLIAAIFLGIGIPHNSDYKIRELTIPTNGENFSAIYFSDLHLNPLFQRSKFEKLIAQADSIQPDFILFGGDLADISDSSMTNAGYDSLFRKLVSKSKILTLAVTGNHEAYMERSGADPEGWLRKVGAVVLNDETICTPVACFTGRVDFQVAKIREIPRKNLKELLPSDLSLPWILMDHQPKGIEKDYMGRLPNLALSGHTHRGQFFPGTVIINLVWRHAYGFSLLDGVPWLVTSGLDSWGLPVRIFSDTEFWVIHFISKN